MRDWSPRRRANGLVRPSPAAYRRQPVRSWLRLALDARRATRDGEAAIADRQAARLAAMLAHAHAKSPIYRERWAGLPPTARLDELPPVSKPELMARFDDWVIDPRLTLAAVEEFVADPDRAGSLLEGDFVVWTTSGTTGRRGVFVHDRVALGVYDALTVTRARALGPMALLRAARRGMRVAAVVATGGHHVSTSMLNLNRRRLGALARRIRTFSVLAPLPRLVAELNAFDPAILVGYPSALQLLAGEAARGVLRIRPAAAIVGGEVLTADGRTAIQRAFGVRVLDQYAASEFHGIAFSCALGRLHVNADWAILEPVERDFSPTPGDRASHTVLLTNLANRVQPIVRYDLGDSVTLHSAPCECGNPLPTITVAGRRGDLLAFRSADGEVAVLPLALTSVIEKTEGVRRFQAYQVADDELRLRLETEEDSAAESTRALVANRVRSFLALQGAVDVRVALDDGPPARDPMTQKFRSIWDARGTSAPGVEEAGQGNDRSR